MLITTHSPWGTSLNWLQEISTPEFFNPKIMNRRIFYPWLFNHRVFLNTHSKLKRISRNILPVNRNLEMATQIITFNMLIVDPSFEFQFSRNYVCFIKIRSKLSSVLLLCLPRIFINQTLNEHMYMNYVHEPRQ